MVKILIAFLAALVLLWAPSVFAGHGGGELLRQTENTSSRR
jgi:hypothetical protein